MRETPDFANPHHCGGAFIGGLLAEGKPQMNADKR